MAVMRGHKWPACSVVQSTGTDGEVSAPRDRDASAPEGGGGRAETPVAAIPAEEGVLAEHPGEVVRRSALSVLDTVAGLKVRDGGRFPPLVDCQSRAVELRERVIFCPPSELPAEARELADGGHALAGLLTVVAGNESMSDAEWAAVHSRVSEAFGRQLAVAAARGRLVT